MNAEDFINNVMNQALDDQASKAVESWLDKFYTNCPYKQRLNNISISGLGSTLDTMTEKVLLAGIAAYYIKKDFVERYAKETHLN